jgi:predicted cupin superfamily sugar epimerase
MQMNFDTTQKLVEHLELEAHIEGGYFRETYRAKEIVDTPRGPRNSMTSIYYCLPSEDFSVWHKVIDAEETFHFHYGDATLIYRVQDRKITTEVLGLPPLGKQTITMPKNTWFAIRPSGIRSPAPYTLMSCSVVPGFEYEDLEIATPALLDELDSSEHKLASSLLKKYPTEA